MNVTKITHADDPDLIVFVDYERPKSQVFAEYDGNNIPVPFQAADLSRDEQRDWRLVNDYIEGR